MKALRGDPQALEGAKRLAANEIFGGRPFVATPEGQLGASLQAALKNMKDPATAKALRVLWGQRGYSQMIALTRRAQQLTYGRAGTRGAVMAPGSALSEAATPLATVLVDASMGARAAAARGILKIASGPKVFYDNTNALQRAAFFEKALVDVDYAKLLLTKVPPSDIRKWNQLAETAKALTLDPVRVAPVAGLQSVQRSQSAGGQ